MMRFAAPIRLAAQRFALPLLVVVSALMIVLGKADTLIFERLRTNVVDIAAPVLDVVSRPIVAFERAIENMRGLVDIYGENARLREENARLLQWQQVARNLSVENTRLRELAKLQPDPAFTYISTRVIANSGGAFARSLLVNAGRLDGIARGQAAVTGEGLAGRIAEVGERASRVLLLTDLNSRVPVAIENSRERGVLAGDNSDQPRLLYLPSRSSVKVGDRIVTSGHGGVFPPGIAVGVVSALDQGIVRIEPYVELARLDYLRVVDYGLSGVLPQPVAPIVRSGKAAKQSQQTLAPGEDRPNR